MNFARACSKPARATELNPLICEIQRTRVKLRRRSIPGWPCLARARGSRFPRRRRLFSRRKLALKPALPRNAKHEPVLFICIFVPGYNSVTHFCAYSRKTQIIKVSQTRKAKYSGSSPQSTGMPTQEVC